MNGLTAYARLLGLLFLQSSCVQYTFAAAIAIASTESSRLVHHADITDSHVEPTVFANLRSMMSAASLNRPIIPTINLDHLSWIKRDMSSSTASGQSAASATTDMSSKAATASSETAVSSDDLITRTIAIRWPDFLFDTNSPVPRPFTETPEYVVVTLIKNHITADPRTTQAISASETGVTTTTSFAPGIEVVTGTATIIKKPYHLPNPMPWLPLPTWMTKEKPKCKTITWTRTHSSTGSATTAAAYNSSSGVSSSVAKESKTLGLAVSYRNTKKT